MYHYLSLNLKQQENKKFNQLIIIPTYLFTLALALEFKGKKKLPKLRWGLILKKKKRKKREVNFVFFFFFLAE